MKGLSFTINDPSAERAPKSVYLLHYRYFCLTVLCFFCFSCPPFVSSLAAPHALFLPPLGALSLLTLAFLTTPAFSLATHCVSASPPLLQPKQFLRLWCDKLVQTVCVALILNHFLKIREIDVKCFT